MLRITLPLDGMTWASLRAFVDLNHAADGGDLVGIEYDESMQEAAGLSELVPANEVKPRG